MDILGAEMFKSNGVVLIPNVTQFLRQVQTETDDTQGNLKTTDDYEPLHQNFQHSSCHIY